ncbi:MAG: hypothetical protein ACFE78_06075 [Candidatus Hodarchaeota archaeon]
MIGIIYISILVLLLLVGIIHGIYAKENYEAETGFAIIVLIYFIVQASSYVLFNLSVENYFKIEISQTLWKISIFIRIFSIGLLSSIHSVELHKHSKIRFLAIIIYFFLEGIIVSLLIFPNSFLAVQQDNDYIYFFQNTTLLVFIFIFNSVVIFFLYISQIMGYKNFNDKSLANFFSTYILLISLNIIFYSIFLITQNIVFRTLYVTLYIINSGFVLYVIIKKPALFLVFTNKIFDFIIFHKSGILLYSYNFQTSKEGDESLLKGSILIGINHILANFTGVEDQLNHIKMSDKGVVFNFQNDLGYAVLLIAKHKNKILENAVQEFIKRFSDKNKEDLLNLSGLIDVTVFKDTGKLIKECFSKYLVKV